MSQEIPVSHLVWRCSDFSEHVEAIVEKVNQKVTVTFEDGFLNSMKVLCEIYNEDPELANDIANDIATDMPVITAKQSDAFESKLQELAEQAARSYKGKYCE